MEKHSSASPASHTTESPSWGQHSATFLATRSLILDASRLLEQAQRLGISVESNTAGLIEQLEEPFALFVCGEFNSGKSSLLNSLAQAKLAEVGLVPTTKELQQLHSPRLDSIQFIDSPGTNSIHKDHQAQTEAYLEIADSVLFVTSVERPLTESEASFLAVVDRKWKRPIVVALNKVDLVDEAGLEEITAYVANGLKELLAAPVSVHAISAKTGVGLNGLIESLQKTYTDTEQIRVKNSSALETLVVYCDSIDDELNELAAECSTGLQVLDLTKERAVHKLEQASLIQELYEEKIDSYFKSASQKFASILEEKFGLVSALRTRVLGKQEALKQQIHSMVQELRIEQELEQIVNDAQDKLLALSREIFKSMERDLDSSTKLAGVQIEAISPPTESLDGTSLSGAFHSAIDSGLNKFFMFGGLAAATGIGVGILPTTAMIDISGFFSALLLTTLSVRALPRERRRIKRQIDQQFESLSETCRDSLRQGMESHVGAVTEQITTSLGHAYDTIQQRLDSVEELRDQIHHCRGNVEVQQKLLLEL